MVEVGPDAGEFQRCCFQMILLSLDTTSRQGSLALMKDGQLLETVSLEAPDGYGQVLFQEVRSLLARHQLKAREIDGYAAACGPGSFTGIRVGLAAIKALAEVHAKPVAGVSNLVAIAAAAEGSLRAPVMDARRGQVYAAVFDDSLRAVLGEIVIEWPNFTAWAGSKDVTLATTDPDLFGPGGAAPLPASWRDRPRVVVPSALAGPVARVAAARFQRGEHLLPEVLEANYVRRPDAELRWKDPL